MIQYQMSESNMMCPLVKVSYLFMFVFHVDIQVSEPFLNSCTSEMDYDDASHEASVSGNVDDSVVESNQVDSLERVSSDGVVIGELENVGEFITGVELDLACASEKLLNLSGFMMHVAVKESDFEAFVSKEDQTSVDSVEKALEFTLLSGILDSEVSELDELMAILQMEITSAQELLSSYTYLGETFAVMEEKLHDSEQSLNQLQDQVSEIRMQSLKFQRTFSCSFEEENCKLLVQNGFGDVLFNIISFSFLLCIG